MGPRGETGRELSEARRQILYEPGCLRSVSARQGYLEGNP